MDCGARILPLCGAGAVVRRQMEEGACILLVGLLTVFIHLRIHSEIGFALNFMVGIYAIVDAYKLAKKTQVKRKDAPPPEQEQPTVRVF